MFLPVGAARAQQADTLEIPASESSLIKRKSIVIVRKRAERPETPGIKFENFTFYSSINLTEYYDDNVFATDDSEEDDLVTVIMPKLELESNWSRHAFNLEAGLEATRHTELSEENTDDAWLNLDAEYELFDLDKLSAGYSYAREHEDRGSADAAAGENPAEYDDSSIDIGFSGSRANSFYWLTFETRKLDYDDVGSPFGEIDYDERDRDERTLGLRYLYRLTPGGAIFVNLETDERDYSRTPDNEGNDRNSDGYRYAVGTELVGSGYVARLYAGRIRRDYQSDDFSDADEFDLGLRLYWRYSASTQLVFKSIRSIEETVLDNSPGYLMRNGSLRLLHELAAGKTLNFDFIASNADYFSIDREDDYLNVGAGYRQQVLPNLDFSVDLHRAERDSNVSGEDYRANQIFVRLRASI